MRPICVMDIGGSNFRCGLYGSAGLIRESVERSSTPNFLNCHGDETRIKRRLVASIVSAYRHKVRRYGRIPDLAIGFPGPVTVQGVIRQSSVVFGRRLAKPFDLRGELLEAFGAARWMPGRIVITNDMTASAWRYSDCGHDPFCLITVSSGIGNKIFSGGKVLIGEDGLAGEIGHYETGLGEMKIPCSCGCGSNHIGMISSGRGIEHFARLFAQKGGRFERLFRAAPWARKIAFDPERIQNELIVAAADGGDPFARAVIDFCTVPLARAICLLSLALFLRRFILIGGFALHCQYYRAALIKSVIAKGIYNYSNHRIRAMIIYGFGDGDDGLIGLGKMVQRDHHRLGLMG